MVISGEGQHDLPKYIECWTPTNDHPEPTRPQILDNHQELNNITSSNGEESPNEFANVRRRPLEQIVSTSAIVWCCLFVATTAGVLNHDTPHLKNECRSLKAPSVLTTCSRIGIAHWGQGKLSSRQNLRSPAQDSGATCGQMRHSKHDS